MTSFENSSNFTSECVEGFIGDYYSTNPNVNKFFGLFVINIVINAISAVSAICGNTIVLTGILITPNLRRTPSYWLIGSQVFSDLAIGLTQPLLSVLFAAEISKGVDVSTKCALGQAILFMCYFLLSATGLSLTALSIDRFLAIRLKTMYKVTVTPKRVGLTITCLWVFSLTLAVIAIHVDDYRCVSIMFLCFASSCSTTITICYTCAIKALKVHMKGINPSRAKPPTNSKKAAIDIHKYKRTLWTMIIIVFVLMVFAIPMCTSWIYIFFKGIQVDSIAIMLTSTTVFNLNSSISPCIYIRMNDIRGASKNVLRKVCCFIPMYFSNNRQVITVVGQPRPG